MAIVTVVAVAAMMASGRGLIGSEQCEHCVWVVCVGCPLAGHRRRVANGDDLPAQAVMCATSEHVQAHVPTSLARGAATVATDKKVAGEGSRKLRAPLLPVVLKPLKAGMRW